MYTNSPFRWYMNSNDQGTTHYYISSAKFLNLLVEFSSVSVDLILTRPPIEPEIRAGIICQKTPKKYMIFNKMPGSSDLQAK